MLLRVAPSFAKFRAPHRSIFLCKRGLLLAQQRSKSSLGSVLVTGSRPNIHMSDCGAEGAAPRTGEPECDALSSATEELREQGNMQASLGKDLQGAPLDTMIVERASAEANRTSATPTAVSFYRRPLPPDCVALDSAQGRRLFERSLYAGRAEPFLPLVSQFTTQSEPAFCGLGSLAMVLNALQVDPGRPWKGPWRWFSEELLDCCLPLHIIAREGITLDEFRCLGECNGALVETAQPPGPRISKAQELSLERFREIVERMCSDVNPRQGNGFLVLCYSREVLQQTGAGHFSPIAAYDEETDRALVLDVARFKYSPHWVQVPLLYQAMCAIDPATGSPRGLAVVRRRKRTEAPDGSVNDFATSLDAKETTVRPCAWRPRLLLLKRLSTQQETAEALNATRTAIRHMFQIEVKEERSSLGTTPMADLIEIWTQHLSRHLDVMPLRVRDANAGCECSSSRRLLLDALQKSPLLVAHRQLNTKPESVTDTDRDLRIAAEAVTIVGMLEYASRVPVSSSPDPLQQALQSQIKRLLGGSELAYDEAKRVADVFAGFVNAAQPLKI
jgi:glutathione gamma-glutamylcysteinyltransferase